MSVEAIIKAPASFRKYLGYKDTELGWIPEDWKLIKLQELIVLSNGYGFSSDYFSNTGPIVITPGNFKKSGGLVFNEKNTLRYSGPYPKAFEFSKGDLLIVMTDLTPECNLLGKPGIIKSDEIILHNQRIGKIKPKSTAVSKDYLYWFFSSDIFSKRMKETATGSTVRHTSNSSINNSLVPLPPTRKEQTAIATALSDMDGYISSLEKLIAKKRLIKQGAMQELLTPKEDWEAKKLGEVLTVRHGKSQKEVEEINGKFPILASGGEIGRSNSYLYNKPSVLIGRKGTIDKPQYMKTPFWTVDTLYYTEIGNNFDAKFIFYQFNLIDWYSYNEASGVPSLSSKTIQNIEIPFPKEKTEQNKISAILDEFEAELNLLENKLKKAKLIKQGAMQELLTGRTRLV